MFGIKKRRRERVLAQPFPPGWARAIERGVPYWRLLTEPERVELRGHVQILLDEKEFVGAGGLEMTEEIAAIIAAQAGVLLLNREHDYFPKLRSIVVYPDTYRAPATREGLTGQAEETVERRLGESWAAGTVVLSWAGVLRGAADPTDAHNVVFHEFAHQLDAEQPRSNGAPRLGSGRAYAAWAEHMGDAFRGLVDDLEQHRRTVLDGYGATNAAEFFAVVTETFFERPHALREQHPELYALFVAFYRQDPAERLPT